MGCGHPSPFPLHDHSVFLYSASALRPLPFCFSPSTAVKFSSLCSRISRISWFHALFPHLFIDGSGPRFAFLGQKFGGGGKNIFKTLVSQQRKSDLTRRITPLAAGSRICYNLLVIIGLRGGGGPENGPAEGAHPPPSFYVSRKRAFFRSRVMILRMMIVISQPMTGAAAAGRGAGAGSAHRPRRAGARMSLPPVPPCASLPRAPAVAHPSARVVVGHFRNH